MRTARLPAGGEKQSGGLFFSARLANPRSPTNQTPYRLPVGGSWFLYLHISCAGTFSFLKVPIPSLCNLYKTPFLILCCMEATDFLKTIDEIDFPLL